MNIGRIKSVAYEGLRAGKINPNHVSVVGLVASVLGALTTILSEDLSAQIVGLVTFVVGRLLDLVDGNYARYLMQKGTWSNKFEGASVDPLCDKGGIYLPLLLFATLKSENTSLELLISVCLMLFLDGVSTVIRKTDWSQVIKSMSAGKEAFQGDEIPVASSGKRANWLGKTKTAVQNTALPALLLHKYFPQGPVVATTLFVGAIVFSIMSLLKKQKLKTA